jgi:hypothetical protein
MPRAPRTQALCRSRGEQLTTQEAMFIQHLIADDLWRPREAAQRAGFPRPANAAAEMMRRPRVQKALGKEQRRRLERLELKADEVLHMLATGLFFNPLSLFKPSADGKWVVTDLDEIPDEIGRCVESVIARSTEKLHDDGTVSTTTYFELKMMGKTKLLELAMKHCGVDGTQKHHHTGSVDLNVGLSLNDLLMEIEETRGSQVIDGTVIESKVLEEDEQ